MSLNALATALLFAAGVQPTTVNGLSLGPVEEFTTQGPATVCMRAMALHARAGESIMLDYSGIHSGRLLLETGRKRLMFDLGDSWKPPEEGELVLERRRLEIYQTRRAGKLAYMVYAPDEDGKMKPYVWVSGSALRGSRSDLKLLGRLSWSNDHGQACNRTYEFGWGVIMGEEPLSSKGNR